MIRFPRRVAAAVLTSTLAVTAVAQTPPPPAAPAPAAPMPVPPPVVTPMTPAVPEQRPTGVAVTVNGQAIPEVAVYRALRQFPPAEREVARKEIVNHLVEQAIVDQYLTALKFTAEPAEVDKLVEELKAELKKGMKEFTKELESMMLTEAEFREAVVEQMKWDKFAKQQSTDEALKKLFDASPNVFDGSMVRARHILIGGTDPLKVEEAKKTLASIKLTIDAEAAKVPAAQKMAKVEELFGAYAKKYSTCPSKDNGGDLNFFPRIGAMVEPFAAAAFALQPGQMTDVVATEFGHHLILVTEKKPGTPKTFLNAKEDVRVLYNMRLREAVVAQMKPKAQIVTTPTPAPVTATPVSK